MLRSRLEWQPWHLWLPLRRRRLPLLRCLMQWNRWHLKPRLGRRRLREVHLSYLRLQLRRRRLLRLHPRPLRPQLRRMRLVIAGMPEDPENPWGVTPFRKVISLPSRIDAHKTSAVVTLYGQLYVRRSRLRSYVVVAGKEKRATKKDDNDDKPLAVCVQKKIAPSTADDDSEDANALALRKTLVTYQRKDSLPKTEQGVKTQESGA